MKRGFLIILIILQNFLFAQKEGNVWYFGSGMGIDFNSNIPLELTDGLMSAWEGCATMSNENGEFLFYTDGIKVFDSTHKVMPNGDGLLGNSSSTQSAIIIKMPYKSSIYYIFTVDHIAGPNGLRYSVVDMTLRNGLGDVTMKNIPIVSPTCEKITAVRHINNIDFWIITHLVNSNTFHSYLLTSKGLNMKPIKSSVGAVTPALPQENTTGYLQASTDGNKIASATLDLNAQVFDFDRSSGKLKNPITFNTDRAYGIEFSPNGNLLYISEDKLKGNTITQFNLLAGSSQSIVNSGVEFKSGFDKRYPGALQLAPDRRIYLTFGNNNTLGVINNPNTLGVGCNYDSLGFVFSKNQTTSSLFTLCGLGLPNLNDALLDTSTFISAQHFCLGDSTLFQFSAYHIPDLVRWDFDDPNTELKNTSSTIKPTHIYSKPGYYNVTLTTHSHGDSTITTYPVIISGTELDFSEDTVLCRGKTFTLDVTTQNATYLWQNASTNPTLKVYREGLYWVQVKVHDCIYSDSVFVTEYVCEAQLKLPNVFTPNSDGKNDLFIPITVKDVKTMRTVIFNRWGNQVYETFNPQIEWDGRDVTEGVYFFSINYTDNWNNNHSLNGNITLFR